MIADPGQKLTLTGMMRSTGHNTITVSWYPDTKGGSRFRETFADPVPADGQWHRFRYDLEMPISLKPGPPEMLPGNIPGRPKRPAVGVFFKLKPGQDAEVQLDELKLIGWQDVEANVDSFYPEYTRLSVPGRLTKTVHRLPQP